MEAKWLQQAGKTFVGKKLKKIINADIRKFPTFERKEKVESKYTGMEEGRGAVTWNTPANLLTVSIMGQPHVTPPNINRTQCRYPLQAEHG